MNYMSSVGVTERVVSRRPESRQPLGAIVLCGGSVERLVRHALAIGVVGQEIQSKAGLMLVSRLHRVVAARSVRNFVKRVGSKGRKRNVIVDVCAYGQNLAWGVMGRKAVQLPP